MGILSIITFFSQSLQNYGGWGGGGRGGPPAPPLATALNNNQKSVCNTQKQRTT